MRRIAEEKKLLIENSDIVKAKLKQKEPIPMLMPDLKNISIKKVLFADSSLATKLEKEKLAKEALLQDKQRFESEIEKARKVQAEIEIKSAERSNQISTTINEVFEQSPLKSSFASSMGTNHYKNRQTQSIGNLKLSGWKYDWSPQTKAAGRAMKSNNYNPINGYVSDPQDVVNKSPTFSYLPKFLKDNYEVTLFH